MHMLEGVTSWVAKLGLFQRTQAREVTEKAGEGVEKDQEKKEGGTAEELFGV